MRWNCPHCKTSLEISSDPNPNSWTFALCAQCSRFGLIRKSTDPIVKVDLPPKGEKFIRGLIATGNNKPVVKRAALRSRPQVITPSASHATPPPPPVQTRAAEAPSITARSVEFVRLPEPLPEVPEKRKSLIPQVVMLGCLSVMCWNAYRYFLNPEQASAQSAQAIEVTDHVASNAMAPTQIEIGSQVMARAADSKLFNGPGYQYPAIGALGEGVKYQVIAINDQWYQLQAGTKTPAWVQADGVIPAN